MPFVPACLSTLCILLWRSVWDCCLFCVPKWLRNLIPEGSVYVDSMCGYWFVPYVSILGGLRVDTVLPVQSVALIHHVVCVVHFKGWLAVHECSHDTSSSLGFCRSPKTIDIAPSTSGTWHCCAMLSHVMSPCHVMCLMLGPNTGAPWDHQAPTNVLQLQVWRPQNVCTHNSNNGFVRKVPQTCTHLQHTALS